MPTRREFLKQTVAAGAILGTSVHAAQDVADGVRALSTASVASRRLSARVRSAVRREETTLRLGGMGDNFHMSWAADDRQYAAVCDGLGWVDKPRAFYNSRLYAIAGEPARATFKEVAGYPELISILKTRDMMRYYGFGTLAVDGRIYQFLSTPNHAFSRVDSSPWPGARFVGAKLIYSPDNGRSWCNQDGSTPVVWENWQDRSRRNMVFFEESQDAFSILSVAQMGRNYSANADGYVYVYSPNGSIDGTMNQLVMFRVPKAQVLNRAAYEYFSGLRDGRATWSIDIEKRAVAHTFPSGWVNTSMHPWAWMPSIAYNRPLGLYMMASWGTGSAPDGSWFAKPSYLGLWISQRPWGPWTQIHEETAWTPLSDPRSRAFSPQISPKWIAEDGRSFWIVWADFQSIATQAEKDRLADIKQQISGQQGTVRYMKELARTMPYYSFNTQRVDLVLA